MRRGDDEVGHPTVDAARPGQWGSPEDIGRVTGVVTLDLRMRFERLIQMSEVNGGGDEGGPGFLGGCGEAAAVRKGRASWGSIRRHRRQTATARRRSTGVEGGKLDGAGGKRGRGRVCRRREVVSIVSVSLWGTMGPPGGGLAHSRLLCDGIDQLPESRTRSLRGKEEEAATPPAPVPSSRRPLAGTP